MCRVWGRARGGRLLVGGAYRHTSLWARIPSHISDGEPPRLLPGERLGERLDACCGLAHACAWVNVLWTCAVPREVGSLGGWGWACAMRQQRTREGAMIGSALQACMFQLWLDRELLWQVMRVARVFRSAGCQGKGLLF